MPNPSSLLPPKPVSRPAKAAELPPRRKPARIALGKVKERTDDLIHLRLAAIARSLPPGQAAESLKTLPESVHVAFPFAWIEPQLARGGVEIPRDRFLEALPSNLRPDFNLPENAGVDLPLDEILQNLPEQRLGEIAPPPVVQPVAFEPLPPAPFDPPKLEPTPPSPAAKVDDHLVLQSIFMTEADLDLAAIAGLINALPGIEGCLAASGDQSAASGEIPKHLRPEDIRGIGSRLFDSAGQTVQTLGIGKQRSHTVQCDESLVSFFVRGHVCLCVFHRGGRGFLPGVRERLDAVADEMARSM